MCWAKLKIGLIREDELEDPPVRYFQSLWSFTNLSQAKYNVVPEEKLASFCSANVPQLWEVFFPAGQCSMPHSQASKGVDGVPPDQDPVMASPISRPESHKKNSEMWSRGRWMVTSHEKKPSCLNSCARSSIKSPNGNVKDWWRACQDTWKLWF